MAERKWLVLGAGLRLPVDVVTQPIAIMGVRRSGKSNAAAVLGEAMHDAGLPWVAIDPKGDWWGLRSSADGKGPGLPIPIFGGLHGDVPITPEAGTLMADLVFDYNLTCVLDVSRFSVAARSRFLVAFGDRLFDRHQADPQPRMVFLEEAHRILPQQVRAEMAHMVGTWTKVISEGGAFGLGIAILDQRFATVNKDGSTQIEALFALRTTSPQDRKAIHDWMVHHALAAQIVESLPSLESGEAWISSSHWLPSYGQDAIQRKQFRQRRTYDSGATPVVGQRRQATTLADIDLGALRDRMTEVTEQAEQNDPAALKRKVATLQREVGALERKLAARPDSEEIASLRYSNAELQRKLDEALTRPPEQVEVQAVSMEQYLALADLAEGMSKTIQDLTFALDRVQPSAPQPTPFPVPGPPPQTRATLKPVRAAPAPATGPPLTSMPPAPPQPVPASNGTPGSLPKTQRAILTVLAQFPDGRTKQQIAMLIGAAANGGGFNNSLGALRTAEYITRGNPITATPEGLAALGGWEPLPGGRALLEHWLARPQIGKAEGEILTVLVDAWPQSLTKDEVAARTPSGYVPTGGGFNNALGRLRTLQLITGRGELIADETLAREVAGG